jgi:hypothetical protein
VEIIGWPSVIWRTIVVALHGSPLAFKPDSINWRIF